METQSSTGTGLATALAGAGWPSPLPQLVTLRVGSVQEAVKRARLALFVCILASCAVFICLWDTYLSWPRSMLFSPANQTLSADKLHDVLVREALREWSDSKTVGINLLGIRVGVNDLSFLGSLGLSLIVYYFLLCIRREHREIAQLLIDYKQEMNQIGYLIYSSICAYLVFNLNTDDSPITSVRQPAKPKKLRFVRGASTSTVFMPAATILAIFASDVLSLALVPNKITGNWFISPFRPAGKAMWTTLSRHDQAVVVVLEAIAIVAAAAVISMTAKIREYQRSTRAILDEYRSMLVESRAIPGNDTEG